MSHDPERLLNPSSDADALERELLGSVRHVGPPEGAKDEAWRAIAGQIAIGAGAAVATSSIATAAAKSSASSLAAWAVGVKVAATVAAGSLTLGGAYLLLGSQAPAHVPTRVVASRAPSTALAATASSAPLPQPDAAVAPSAPVQAEAPARKTELKRTDLLRAESALLTEARAQLRAGNAASAQAALDKLHAQFPKGVLAQEREILAIEVQYARGNLESARRRARAFIKAYPQSPHSAKLGRFVD